MSSLYKIGWFSSGDSVNSRNLLTATVESMRKGEIEAGIDFVFCTCEPGERSETDKFIQLVRDYDIPLVCYSYQKFKAKQDTPARDSSGLLADWRLEYDREVMRLLAEFKPEISVLAGYMLVTGPELCYHYDMINLHPSAPGGPTGTWRQVIWRLIESGADENGALILLATPEMDKGPVLTYCTYPIKGGPFDRLWEEIKGRTVKEIKQTEGTENALFELIRSHGLVREIPLILSTIKLFARGTLRVNSSKLVVDVEDYPILPFNLTEDVSARLGISR